MPASIVATPEPNIPPDASSPRVRLDVTIPAGATGVSVMIVRRSQDEHDTPVRLADPAVMTGTAWVGYDYECPFGSLIEYRADVTYLNPGTIIDYAASLCQLDSTRVWLIHPGVPAFSMPLPKITSLGQRSRQVSRGIFEPYGRTTPIIVTDGKRKAPVAQLTVRTRTLSELGQFQRVTADASVLLLNVPLGFAWGSGEAQTGSEYISLGDLTETRETDIGNDEHRLVSGPYSVVSRPIGGSQSERTWGALMSEAATWQDVLNMYPSWVDVLAPTT